MISVLDDPRVLATVEETFKDVPLTIRIRAWQIFSMLPIDIHDGARLYFTSGETGNRVGGNSTVCCPWGAVLLAAAAGDTVLDHQIRDDGAMLQPRSSVVKTVIAVLTHGLWGIEQERTWMISAFMALVDDGRLSSEDIHRLMVPEEFQESFHAPH